MQRMSGTANSSSVWERIGRTDPCLIYQETLIPVLLPI
jgi:hypothetical protein